MENKIKEIGFCRFRTGFQGRSKPQRLLSCQSIRERIKAWILFVIGLFGGTRELQEPVRRKNHVKPRSRKNHKRNSPGAKSKRNFKRP